MRKLSIGFIIFLLLKAMYVYNVNHDKYFPDQASPPNAVANTNAPKSDQPNRFAEIDKRYSEIGLPHLQPTQSPQNNLDDEIISIFCNGSLDEIKFFIEDIKIDAHRAYSGYYDATLFLAALIANPSVGVAKYLIESTTNGLPAFFTPQKIGETNEFPIIYAIHRNTSVSVIRYLVSVFCAKAHDVYAFPEKEKAEMLAQFALAALRNPNIEVLKAILAFPVDINAQFEPRGMTLLIIASAIFTPRHVSSLLDAGASANIKDGSGFRAIDYAVKNPKLKGTPEYWRLYNASF